MDSSTIERLDAKAGAMFAAMRARYFAVATELSRRDDDIAAWGEQLIKEVGEKYAEVLDNMDRLRDETAEKVDAAVAVLEGLCSSLEVDAPRPDAEKPLYERLAQLEEWIGRYREQIDAETGNINAATSKQPSGCTQTETIKSMTGKTWMRQLYKNSVKEQSYKRRSTMKMVKTEVTEDLEMISDSFGNISINVPVGETPENRLSARDNVLRKCGQIEPEAFGVHYNADTLINCQKIGEGTFGEVFQFGMSSKDLRIIKVVPIEGDQLVNGEKQKKFDEVLSEIIIAKTLSDLRRNGTNCTDAFNEVLRVRCVEGVYPEILVKEWEKFDQNKSSENDHPSMFRCDQLYIVLELKHGGTPLENFKFQTAKQSYYVFQQVAFALAIAESEYKFEHRDLHWGNILLKKAKPYEEVKCRCNGTDFSIPTLGIRVTLIDFTLSRAEIDKMVIFNDLTEDDELFKGDAKVDYQFEIYRLMKKKNNNDWQKFEPFSNLLWLHYVLNKILREKAYVESVLPVPKGKLGDLLKYSDDILNCDTATSFVTSTFTQRKSPRVERRAAAAAATGHHRPGFHLRPDSYGERHQSLVPAGREPAAGPLPDPEPTAATVPAELPTTTAGAAAAGAAKHRPKQQRQRHRQRRLHEPDVRDQR